MCRVSELDKYQFLLIKMFESTLDAERVGIFYTRPSSSLDLHLQSNFNSSFNHEKIAMQYKTVFAV